MNSEWLGPVRLGGKLCSVQGSATQPPQLGPALHQSHMPELELCKGFGPGEKLSLCCLGREMIPQKNVLTVHSDLELCQHFSWFLGEATDTQECFQGISSRSGIPRSYAEQKARNSVGDCLGMGGLCAPYNSQ